MGVTFKYTHLVTIDSTGKLKSVEIPTARAFFALAFPAFVNKSDIPEPLVQRQLLRWIREPADSPDAIERSQSALRCLLCLMSWDIKEACDRLAAQFGQFHGFTASELLRYVLDDDGTFPFSSAYQPFAAQILESFKPEQGSLMSWANLRVKHHPSLNHFLIERGLYLVSDWAILNDTNPQQLERVFREFHHLTPVEIERGKRLLASYHAIYRAERLQQRKNGAIGRTNSRCQPPTYEQLQQIALQLKEPISPETVTSQLQAMASLLREYRIHARGGALPADSLDAKLGSKQSLAEKLAAPQSNRLSEPEDNESEFLREYRRQLEGCLKEAIAQVTEVRVKKLERREPEKAAQFLLALQLFHCQGKSMSDIAREIQELKAQYQVTRLLKLKSFRADVRQQLLVKLRDRVLQLAGSYSSPERLKQLEQHIGAFLEEQTDRIIEDAQKEAGTGKNRATLSLFALQLCRYLDRKLARS